MDITMTLEQYQALVALSRRGTSSSDQQLSLEEFLVDIEKKNGIIRYLLWVQWQELEQALPPTVKFPEVWPPELRRLLQQINRPIARADVDAVLSAAAKKPTNILVTRDPAALVGWTPIDVFFRVS